MEFIKKTFYEEDISLVQEWFGFHLIRRYIFKKAVIFHGEKNTGKTVALNLLTTFLGNNVSGLSLQDISKGKPFDLLALKDKDANICDDLSSADMKAVGGFKMSVGDGWINGEMKFGDKIRFKNTAKDTNSCNKIPSSEIDIDDEAYYDRVLLIPVDNVIPKEERNKNLIDELTTPEELGGLLNWAIEGYRRLVKQNGFSHEKTPEETKFLMLQNGNSLAEFATDILIQADGSKVCKESMYKIYCNWCINHKPQLSPDSKEKIGRSLTRFAPYTQASSNGKERYWLNVKVSNKYDTYDTIQNNMSNYGNSNNAIKNNIYNFSESVISVSKKESEKPLFSEQELINQGYSEQEALEILQEMKGGKQNEHF
jgi:putative DNA primase/helicase